MSDPVLEVVEQLYNPAGLDTRFIKRIDELRTLTKQYENTVEQARAAESSMQRARHLAAEDVLKAEQLMNDALDTKDKAEEQYRVATDLLHANRQKETELIEREHHLNNREALIDLKQGNLNKLQQQLRDQLN